MNEDAVLDVIEVEADEDIPELPPLRQPMVERKKAGHRQSRVSDDITPSWWVTASPNGFTRIGEQETAKTAHTRAGASVGFRLLQE